MACRVAGAGGLTYGARVERGGGQGGQDVDGLGLDALVGDSATRTGSMTGLDGVYVFSTIARASA
ncbi:hypothetical protein DQ384_37545 [Sphaerisporangium album]|uniref:Uncharacterized protein n=1 Tax=Sphaerisporangium album TaxID=509200 RepID=A0A367ESQ2_9ACTN|nr:hypothetical protein DQ384_37545 [Sphaerisporangium album]